MKIVVVKGYNEEKKRPVHYSYLDLGYRRLMLPFGESSIVTNAELLGLSPLAYLDLKDGSYEVVSPGSYKEI